jgi:hypothetical protein
MRLSYTISSFILATTLFGSGGNALTVNDKIFQFKIIKDGTDKGLLDVFEEHELREDVRKEYKEEHTGKLIGQSFQNIPGFAPSSEPSYSLSDLGSPIELTFSYIVNDTGERIAPPVDVAFVLYEGLFDPSTSTFTELGTSSDSASDYSFSWVLQGSEPIIVGIPFDLSGNPYPEEANWGASLNLLAIPEPSKWALILTGFSGLGFVNYRRTRGRRWSADSH